MTKKEKVVCSLADKCSFDCFHKKPHDCDASCSLPCQRSKKTKGATCEPVKKEKQVVCNQAANCTGVCHHRTPHEHHRKCDVTCVLNKGHCEPVPETKIPYETTSTQSVTVQKEPYLYICSKHETCGSVDCEHKFHHTHMPNCNVSGCLRDGDCKCVPYTPPAKIYARLYTRLQAIEQQLDEAIKQRETPQIRVTGDAAEQLHKHLVNLISVYGFMPEKGAHRIEQFLSAYGLVISPNKEE